MITELLLNVIDRQTDSGVIFRQKRCLRSRLRSNSCDTCLRLCRCGALALEGRDIVFNTKRCTGCMLCVAECPNDAFVADFDIADLLPRIGGENCSLPQTITCNRNSSLQSDLTIPCIGLLSEPVLAGLNCTAPVEVYLHVHSCSNCENGHVLDLLYEKLQNILEKSGWAEGLKVRCQSVDSVLADHPGKMRRAFLSMTRKSMLTVGREASAVLDSSKKEAENESSLGKEKVCVSRFLQMALAGLPADRKRERQLLESYFYSVKTNDDCDLCPLCTGMCPTGAIKRKSASDMKLLYFTPSKCSGCGLCVEFCNKRALTLLPGVQINPAVVEVIAEEKSRSLA